MAIVFSVFVGVIIGTFAGVMLMALMQINRGSGNDDD